MQLAKLLSSLKGLEDFKNASPELVALVEEMEAEVAKKNKGSIKKLMARLDSLENESLDVWFLVSLIGECIRGRKESLLAEPTYIGFPPKYNHLQFLETEFKLSSMGLQDLIKVFHKLVLKTKPVRSRKNKQVEQGDTSPEVLAILAEEEAIPFE